MTSHPIVYRTTVSPDWVDYNGHMRDAYYGLVFSYAIDAVMVELGLDEDYRVRTKGTLYVVELHQAFLKEAHEGAPLAVAARLLDADHKRLHLQFALFGADGEACLAVQESLQLHVVQDGDPRSAPFGTTIQGEVDRMLAAHAALPVFEPRSRSIAIRRR